MTWQFHFGRHVTLEHIRLGWNVGVEYIPRIGLYFGLIWFALVIHPAREEGI